MWFNCFLFLVVICCYFLGGVLGLHSNTQEKEVTEVEAHGNAEWSFRKKDFVPTTQVQSPVPVEQREKSDGKSGGDEPHGIGTQNGEKDSYNPLVSPSPLKIMETDYHYQ
ncbi:MAG: hypothetical protein LBF34_04040, partial [Puniceicoccales bacterium]|nr:hypothetical protein [Puniceicoccales bacterium]